MSFDKALSKLVKDELKKAQQKMKYRIDVRLVGNDEICYRIDMSFPPYLGLKVRIKMKDESYFQGKIIDIEWDEEESIFNALCEVY